MAENNEEKLQHFTAAILTDAWEEVNAINQEIKDESEAVLSAADDEALADAFRYIKAEVSRIESDCGRRISRAVMANKREMFLRREAMADEVMEAVGGRLAAFINTPDYIEYLKDVLTFTLAAFDGEATVWLRPEDMPLAGELSSVPSEYPFSFEEGTFSVGGLEAACPEKNLHADATFDSKVFELRGHFAELFGLQLKE